MVESTQKYKRAAHQNAQNDARERILHAATHLFGARGYDATSIQAIADAVGIRKQSLLYHYPSKEALHAHVVQQCLLHWRDELPKLLNARSSYDRFSSLLDALITFFRTDPDRARLALREMLDRPEPLRAQMETLLSPLLRLLTDYIRMGQASGLIKPDLHPESYVIQVVMMVISTVAFGGVASALVGEQDEPHASELIRIAREALFIDPPTTPQQG